MLALTLQPVMPSLVPGIHVFLIVQRAKEDVDGRDNPRNRCGDCSPGHDEAGRSR
jgi:hypothetical protein